MAEHWIGPGIVILPWLLAVLITMVVGRRAHLPSFFLVVTIVGMSWVFAILAASLFPFPLPPYSSIPLGGGPFENLPNSWLNPIPFQTLARATRFGGFGMA